jgi:membrane protease YdiL (CAAX protease family)
LVIALFIYFLSPFLLLRIHRLGALAAILALWIPVEFGLFRRLGVPSWMAIVVGMSAAVLAFRSRRDAFDASSAFDPRRLSFKDAVVNFGFFALIGIPLGIAIGFIAPVFDLPALRSIPVLAGSIFLFTALPEEILFRGIIQHSIESRLKNRTASAVIAALVFGSAHLNNGAPVPNYRYFLLASVAGVFYGIAWRRHKNVLTSSITHTLVNTSWRLFFR